MGLRDRDPGGYTPMSDDEETDDPLVADVRNHDRCVAGTPFSKGSR
jgi:hypothetical protein